MKNITKNTSMRWFYLVVGIIAMLFAGVLYAWSILKSPLATEFQWGASELALNFTLAMSFFCIGGLLGAQISKRAGHRIALITSGVLSALGFVLTAYLSGASVAPLYVTYGVLAGLGIGIAYNVVIATVSAWFPDKKGFCSGCLMMGFGASALILGNVANTLFKSTLGWRTTYIVLGIAICAITILASLLLTKPTEETVLPQPKITTSSSTEVFKHTDYAAIQMLRRPSFWMAFVCISFLAAVGSSVISFAKDLALSVNATESLAVTLVGILSVCNGLGRILTGAIFDTIGRRKSTYNYCCRCNLGCRYNWLFVSLHSRFVFDRHFLWSMSYYYCRIYFFLLWNEIFFNKHGTYDIHSNGRFAYCNRVK